MNNRPAHTDNGNIEHTHRVHVGEAIRNKKLKLKEEEEVVSLANLRFNGALGRSFRSTGRSEVRKATDQETTRREKENCGKGDFEEYTLSSTLQQ